MAEPRGSHVWQGDGETVALLEKSLLGSILIDGSKAVNRIAGIVTPDDFLIVQHSVIYQGILDVAGLGQSPDLVLVGNELERSGRLDRAGGIVYFTHLIDRVPDVDNVVNYALRVKEEAVLRRVRKKASLAS